MIDGGLAALGPTLVVLAYAFVVGAALRLVVAPWLNVPRGFGVTAGLGLSVAAVAVALAHYASIGPASVVLPILAASVVALALVVARTVLGARRDGSPVRSALHRTLRDLLPVPADAVAVIATIVVIGPLLRFGLTYWTSFANDYPNYAASVQVWLTAGGDGPTFLERHPDHFGAYQVWRSDAEKPTATGVLITVTRLTGLPAWSLLTPTMVVTMVVLVSALLTFVAAVLPCAGALGVLAVVVPSLSIVPVSRLLDAQVGHLVQVALAAVVLVVLSAATRTGRRGDAWVHRAVAALTLAACAGANVSLLLGSAPMLAALAVWAAVRRGAPPVGFLVDAAWTGALALVLSVPFLPSFTDALSRQSGGEAGFGIPLAGPAAVVGLQATLADAGPTRHVVLQWAGVLALGTLLYVLYRRRVPGSWWTAALVAVTVANGAVLVARFSASNYSVHKWCAVAVALVAPVLLARGAEVLRTRVRRAVPVAAVVAVGLVAVSASSAWKAAEQVRTAVPDELLALADVPEVSGDRTVNVNLGTMYDDSIAPLVLQASRVVVTGVTYAVPACPEGNLLLTRESALERWPHTAVTRLDGDLVLVDLDLRLAAGTVRFGPTWPEASGHLCGRWHAPEEAGARAIDPTASVVLDLADDLRGGPVVITLLGEWGATGGEWPSTVLVNGTAVPVVVTPSGDLESMTVRVPADLPDEGRIVIAPWDARAGAAPGGTDAAAAPLLVSLSVVRG